MIKLFADLLDKIVKLCNNAPVIEDKFRGSLWNLSRPEGEETLENPVQTGAEGARRKPNLSGKRTEQGAISCVNLCVVFQSCRPDCGAALFVFGCEYTSEERTT